MTRRPVQQARRITDRQLLDWPERETYVWSPTRATRVDVIELVVGTVVMSAVFLALVLALIVASGAAA